MVDKAELANAEAEAMITSCDLWALPSPRYSHWFTRLDWYLNWQMCKGLAYAGLHLPSETHRVAEEYGVPVSTLNAEHSSPLLIASGGRVATQQCLVVDGSHDIKAWLRQVFRVAESLKAGSVRVFLPTGCATETAAQLWPGPLNEVHFIADLEAPTHD